MLGHSHEQDAVEVAGGGGVSHEQDAVEVASGGGVSHEQGAVEAFQVVGGYGSHEQDAEEVAGGGQCGAGNGGGSFGTMMISSSLKCTCRGCTGGGIGARPCTTPSGPMMSMLVTLPLPNNSSLASLLLCLIRLDAAWSKCDVHNDICCAGTAHQEAPPGHAPQGYPWSSRTVVHAESVMVVHAQSGTVVCTCACVCARYGTVV